MFRGLAREQRQAQLFEEFASAQFIQVASGRDAGDGEIGHKRSPQSFQPGSAKKIWVVA
ncbi:MAG: hypothetical protein ACI8XO_001158 [Verrucomicrobiales bacterium]|jgi:hypothetical protein